MPSKSLRTATLVLFWTESDQHRLRNGSGQQLISIDPKDVIDILIFTKTHRAHRLITSLPDLRAVPVRVRQRRSCHHLAMLQFSKVVGQSPIPSPGPITVCCSKSANKIISLCHRQMWNKFSTSSLGAGDSSSWLETNARHVAWRNTRCNHNGKVLVTGSGGRIIHHPVLGSAPNRLNRTAANSIWTWLATSSSRPFTRCIQLAPVVINIGWLAPGSTGTRYLEELPPALLETVPLLYR